MKFLKAKKDNTKIYKGRLNYSDIPNLNSLTFIPSSELAEYVYIIFNDNTFIWSNVYFRRKVLVLIYVPIQIIMFIIFSLINTSYNAGEEFVLCILFSVLLLSTILGIYQYIKEKKFSKELSDFVCFEGKIENGYIKDIPVFNDENDELIDSVNDKNVGLIIMKNKIKDTRKEGKIKVVIFEKKAWEIKSLDEIFI